MTENDAIAKFKRTSVLWESATNTEMVEAVKVAIQAIEEIQQYRAIGTIEELKALKEKNTPMELDKHNFQDEVHHYLCPSCRNIVSCTQNYCEECGQALEV